MIKTVDKIQKQFTKMIQDLENIISREEENAVKADRELARANKESARASKFRDNLKSLVGDDDV